MTDYFSGRRVVVERVIKSRIRLENLEILLMSGCMQSRRRAMVGGLRGSSWFWRSCKAVSQRSSSLRRASLRPVEDPIRHPVT